MKKGKIIPNGVSLQKHEYDMVLFLTEQGYDIELIPKSDKQGEHKPDIRMEKLLLEMKSPKGGGGQLIKNTIQRALKQSPNVIIDLRCTKRHQTKCLRELKSQFDNSKTIKRLKIITKARKSIDMMK